MLSMKRRSRWIAASAAALLGLGLVAAPAIAKGPPDGIGDETSNNLSYPAIWADGTAKAVPGTELQSSLTVPLTVVDGVTWYQQGVTGNTWQAENELATGTVPISSVEWGDNLARPWADGAKVRVETVLHNTLDPATPMQGFTMQYFGGEGIDEVWGTDGSLYDSTDATVYTQLGWLTITQMTDAAGDPLTTPLKVVDQAYGSEVNVQGKVIFGAQWDTKTDGGTAGIYRVTMSFTGTTNVDLSGATSNHGSVDGTANTTSVDVTITSNRGGGGGTPGGGTPGGGGGGGSIPDSDGDGLANNVDNCVEVPNPDQADSDGDGIGDACDPDVPTATVDTDGDRVLDAEDNCKFMKNPNQKDTNGNGIGDACDPEPKKVTGKP